MAKKKTLSEYEKAHTREVTMLGKKFRVRKVNPSNDAIKALGKYRTKYEIVGHLAINPIEIEAKIRLMKANIMREMALMHPEERELFIAKGPIDFVKDKGRRKRFNVLCGKCGDKVAYVWAKNEKLEDWCDMHYVTWYDRESWHGAMAVNISPIDQGIGFECACGEDTRDFRTNRSMPPIQRNLMIEYSQKHRDFGKGTSAFVAIAT